MDTTTISQDAQTYFARIVAELAEKAKLAYPNDENLILNGCALIAAEKVSQENGYVCVESQTRAAHYYHVGHRCECPAMQRFDRCSHMWAKTLYRMALAVLQDEAELENARRSMRQYPVVGTTRPPYKPELCQCGRYKVRRQIAAGPVWGHIDRARRFTRCAFA